MSSSFEDLDIHAAKKLIDQQAVTIVDIRAPEYYQHSRIAQSLSVDDGNIAEFLKNTSKDKPLLCYCHHGISSRSAAGYFFSARISKNL